MSNLVNLVEALLGSMYICSFEAKNRVFEFNHQKDEHVRFRLMFEKWLSSSFDVRPITSATNLGCTMFDQVLCAFDVQKMTFEYVRSFTTLCLILDEVGNTASVHLFAS